MQIEDIIQKIDFHDSCVIELSHDNDKVKLKIDLCMWRQEGYKEGELKEVCLEFDPAADYIWDSYKAETEIDYDTILNVSYSNGIIKIILYDDFADDGTSIITFKCNTVEFT